MVQESQDRQFQDVQSTSPSTGSPGSETLDEVQEVVRQVAQGCQGNPEALLGLLRLLEALHREICEQEFRPALPDTAGACTRFCEKLSRKGLALYSSDASENPVGSPRSPTVGLVRPVSGLTFGKIG